MSLTVTTRKKPTVNIQKNMRRKSQNNTKENHQNTRKEIKKKGAQSNYNTARKQLAK